MQELSPEKFASYGTIGQSERATQNRVVALFRDELGYRVSSATGATARATAISKRNCFRSWLSEKRIQRRANCQRRLQAAHRGEQPQPQPYGNNQAVYGLLRYGVPVKTEVGKVTETVHLIDWDNPENNDFAIAEEVTLKGDQERRPDLVLYVNGIAVGMLELKNSRTSIGDGIRQSLSNQQPMFNAWFFSTVQLIFAGNDSEGLQYATIGTPEKYCLKWKEDEADNSRFKLDKYLLKMCRKDRLIELMHDFVLFDSGVKKLPRVHQYFAIKAAQHHVREQEGRHHLAHARQRQEHRDGAARQMDFGEQPQRPRRHHHRPRRIG